MIAEDDPVMRHALRVNLERWEYEVVECADGEAAWQVMRDPSPPLMATMDWNMPGGGRPDVVPGSTRDAVVVGVYIILLTSNAS